MRFRLVVVRNLYMIKNEENQTTLSTNSRSSVMCTFDPFFDRGLNPSLQYAESMTYPLYIPDEVCRNKFKVCATWDFSRWYTNLCLIVFCSFHDLGWSTMDRTNLIITELLYIYIICTRTDKLYPKMSTFNKLCYCYSYILILMLKYKNYNFPKTCVSRHVQKRLILMTIVEACWKDLRDIINTA